TTGQLTVCCLGSDGGAGGSSVPNCRPGCAPQVQAPQCSPAVARCVLAVLDDLQCTTSAKRRSYDGRSHSSDGREIPRAATSRHLPFFEHFHDLSRHRPFIDDTASESSYDSASDYHLYEEILYEATTSSSLKPTEILPPPLPARPPHLFRNVKSPKNLSQEHQVLVKSLRSHAKCLSHHQPLLVVQRSQLPEVQNSQLNENHIQVSSSSPSSSSSKPADKSQKSTNSQNASWQQLQEAKQQKTEQQLNQTNSLQTQQNQSNTKPTPPPKPPKPPRTSLPPPKLSTSTITKTTASPSSSKQLQKSPQETPLLQDHQSLPQQQQMQNQTMESSVLKPQTNKPKQRCNLYSIFKDRDHRRCLSASLQKEYQQDFQENYLPEQKGNSPVKVGTCAAVAGADDDYGFKVVPHVV
ncbi:hypothetical protein SK128_017518, partial [Halocaridina rubra]